MDNIKQFLQDLKAQGIANNVPNISEKVATFLQDMIIISNAQDVLEIGTANGYSTIQMAQALRQKAGGNITTIDRSIPTYQESLDNFAKAQVYNMIESIFANALDVLPNLTPNSYDFVFIDAMKKLTKDFFLLSWPLVRENGVIIIDDVIKFEHKMDGFFAMLEEKNIPYTVCKIDEDDGICLVRKQSLPL